MSFPPACKARHLPRHPSPYHTPFCAARPHATPTGPGAPGPAPHAALHGVHRCGAPQQLQRRLAAVDTQHRGGTYGAPGARERGWGFSVAPVGGAIAVPPSRARDGERSCSGRVGLTSKSSVRCSNPMLIEPMSSRSAGFAFGINRRLIRSRVYSPGWCLSAACGQTELGAVMRQQHAEATNLWGEGLKSEELSKRARGRSKQLLVASLFLVAMPGAPSSVLYSPPTANHRNHVLCRSIVTPNPQPPRWRWKKRAPSFSHEDVAVDVQHTGERTPHEVGQHQAILSLVVVPASLLATEQVLGSVFGPRKGWVSSGPV